MIGCSGLLLHTYATRGGLSMNDSSESSPIRSNSTLFSNILGTIRSEQHIIKAKPFAAELAVHDFEVVFYTT